MNGVALCIASHQDDFVTNRNVRDVTDIEHDPVHADGADNRGSHPPDKSLPAIREGTPVPVRIADRNTGNQGLFTRYIASCVADTRSRLYRFDHGDPALERHDRYQVHLPGKIG